MAFERDISLKAAARATGHSPSTLRDVWHEIPTAFVTEGGRYWVNPAGLRDWLFKRGRGQTEARAATRAS